MVAEDDQADDGDGQARPRDPGNHQDQSGDQDRKSGHNPHRFPHGGDCSTRTTELWYGGPIQTYYTKSNVKYQNRNSAEKPLNTLTKGLRTYKFREVNVVEQRRSKRFDVKLPVKLLRNGLRSISGVGETKNLSSGGVLFNSDTRIDIGEPVEYLISLSPEGEVNLHCLGKVIRLDGGEGARQEPAMPFEVAATLERYEFVRNHA
jgi:hypothetical protein